GGDAAPAGAVGAGVLHRRLPAPGMIELEELLAAYLNTRVKVEMGGSRGRVLVDFATLEDLERIYKLMVGGGGR
ncbi:MAG: chromosome partitioning protein ParB, partial [Actinomycetota bacterium]|nr:chromosome partitioning protein ParB [Actinomycetota bacterium]